jgi:hypothetical protein
MAGGVSGKGGDVTVGTTTPVQLCEVTKWSFNPKITISKYASNCSGGAKRTVIGSKEGSGSFEGKWDPSAPPIALVDVGSVVTLNLTITGTHKYIVPAIIESMKVDVDMDSGDIVSWSADWQADGAWTNPPALAFAGPFPGGMVPQEAFAAGPAAPVVPGQPEPQPLRPAARPAAQQAAPGGAAPGGLPAGFDPQQFAALVAQAVVGALAAHPAFAARPQQPAAQAA